MTLRRFFLALVIWLAALSCRPEPGLAQEPSDPATRKVLVMTRLMPAHFQLNSGYGGAYGTSQARRARLRVARHVARTNGLTITDDWPMPLLAMACFVMEVPGDRSVDQGLGQLARDPNVVFAERMQIYTAQSHPVSYDDPLFPAQTAATVWQLATLHRISTGSNVPVAVIDSGIADDHPDLSGQVAMNVNFVANRPFRAETHGTAVAGVIAAKAGNHLGIVGIAPNARLWGLRACWQQMRTVCDTLSLAKALHFAIDRGARVINMSLAGPPGELLDRLLDSALARKISVVAAYDPGLPGGGFPASRRGVIAVAEDGQRTYRNGVYTAPGRDVVTTLLGGGWGLASGSSFAAAHVSGLLALARAKSHGNLPILVTRRGNTGIDACTTMLRVGRRCDCDCTRTAEVAADAAR
jgi:subtilisin family serine protease